MNTDKNPGEGISNEEPGTPLTAEEYGEILKGLHLINIGLNTVQSNITNRQGINSGVPMVPKLESSCQFWAAPREESSRVIVYQIVALMLMLEDAQNETPAYHLGFVFQIDYDSDKPFTKEFFEIFKNGPLIAHIHPYVREFMYNMTLRASIPAYVLPLTVVDFTEQMFPTNEDSLA